MKILPRSARLTGSFTCPRLEENMTKIHLPDWQVYLPWVKPCFFTVVFHIVSSHIWLWWSKTGSCNISVMSTSHQSWLSSIGYVYWPGIHFAKIYGLIIQCFIMIHLIYVIETDHLINSQFCTCHDSSAVMTCAKLTHDCIIGIQIKTNRIVTRF